MENYIKDFLFAGLFAAGAAGCASFYFNTNKYDILWGALIGAIGWVTYILILKFFKSSGIAYFTGAFSVALLSEIFARIIKNPATVYLLPALLPLVPGGGMFQTMQAAVSGNMESAMSLGFSTLGAAGAIALGIAVVSSFSKMLK